MDTPLVEIVPEFGAITPRGIDGGQDPHTRQMLPAPPERSGETVDPAQITLFHLLTHTSGLAPWRAVFDAAGPVPPPPALGNSYDRAGRWQRGLQAICGYPFVGQPGEAVRYSDLGFMLLGEVVSRLAWHPRRPRNGDPRPRHRADAVELAAVQSGAARDRAVRASSPTEYDTLWRQRRAWGEVHDENACGVGGVAGHAGLFGTARDVARFGQAWLSGDLPRDRAGAA